MMLPLTHNLSNKSWWTLDIFFQWSTKPLWHLRFSWSTNRCIDSDDSLFDKSQNPSSSGPMLLSIWLVRSSMHHRIAMSDSWWGSVWWFLAVISQYCLPCWVEFSRSVSSFSRLLSHLMRNSLVFQYPLELSIFQVCLQVSYHGLTLRSWSKIVLFYISNQKDPAGQSMIECCRLRFHRQIFWTLYRS